MAARLLNHDKMKAGDKTIEKKIDDFLSPTCEADPGEIPLINDHYKATAKQVDNFNQQLGYIKYNKRIHSAEMCKFIHTMKMILVNSWMLYMDVHAMDASKATEDNLHWFIDQLSESILGISNSE